MRVDHHACQKATTTSLTGLIIQILIATSLLVFGLVAQSTAFIFASLFAWVGIFIWLGLIILFYQEKLQVLETIEESELTGNEATTIFDSAGDEIRPAAARLKFLHRWMMPLLSLFVSAALIVIALNIFRFLDRLDHQDDVLQTTISQTPYIGWALALSMSFALTSFIYSRFIAGMADVKVWSNLRGGASWMVGNAILLVAISIGLLFKFFDNDQVLLAICWGIPIFMLLVSAEIVVNFVLNLYRPRIQGESPRPAFDSKSLSIFASPDSLFKSINEAINYQFGFDITSSWGYKLLIRSFAWLIGLAGAVLLIMSSLVIIEPMEQGIRIRQGALIGDVHQPGMMFKLPWPIESSKVIDVTRVRDLSITFKWKEDRNVILWTDEYYQHAVRRPNPFIVNDKQIGNESITDDLLSLVDVQAFLRYRIKDDGLLDWLHFGSDEVDRRSRLTQREIAILAISQGSLTEMFQKLEIDDLLSVDRVSICDHATDHIQSALDKYQSGIEVLAVNIPLISPAGDAAGSFEEISVAIQGEERLISAARGHSQSLLTATVGDPALVEKVVLAVANYNEAKTKVEQLDKSTTQSETLTEANKQLASAEQHAMEVLEQGNGNAAATIRTARVKRWVTIMDNWARSSRVKGQSKAFEVAPRLYMQRMYMSVLAKRLPKMRKYVIGIDPERINLDVELRNINPLLNFVDALESDEEGDQ